MNKLIPLICAILLILVACQNEPLPPVIDPGDPTQDAVDIPPAPQIVEVEIEATAGVLSSGATDEDFDMSSDPAEDEVVVDEGLSDSTAFIQAGFGVGPKVQVISPSGQRLIQYVKWDPSPEPLTFRLYPYSFDQFLEELPLEYFHLSVHDNFEKFPINKQLGEPTFEWEGVLREYDGEETKGIQQTPLPENVPVGIYFLEMYAGDSIDTLLLFVSENLVTAQGAGDEVVAWVSDVGGRPQAEIETLLISEKGNVLSRGESNESGLARLDITAGDQEIPNFLVARDGEDYSITALSKEWGEFQKSRPLWYVSDTRWAPEDIRPDNYKVEIILDQPIYRPGQTINFKAIVRNNRDGAYEVVPSNRSINVALVKNYLHKEQDRFLETEALLSDFGSAIGQLQLSDDIGKDVYEIEVTFDGETYQQEVAIAEFDLAKFNVRVQPKQTNVISGDEVALEIEVLNLDGSPVAFGEVEVVVFELRTTFERYPDDTLWWHTPKADVPSPKSLDEFGRTEIKLPMVPDVKRGLRVDRAFKFKQPPPLSKMGVEVTISSGRKIGKHFVPIEVAPYAGEIKTKFEQWSPAAERPFNVSFEARTLLGDPLVNHPFDFEIGLWNEEESEMSETVYTISSVTDGDGKAKLQIPGLEAGSYQAIATGPDLYSNPVNVHVAPTDGGEIEYDVPNGIGLTAENNEVTPGQPAILYVESAKDGAGFLSVERGSVRRVLPIEFTAPVTRIELPIVEEDAPEIYVTLNGYHSTALPQEPAEGDEEAAPKLGVDLGQNRSGLFSAGDATFWTDRVKLTVPNFNKRLNVEIVSSATEYRLGETGTFTFRVTNQEGVPVSAELSVSIVDEAIVGVGRRLNEPFYDQFYRYDHQVQVFSSSALERFLRLGPMGGPDGGGYYPDPESHTHDPLFWAGNLVTDFKGEVEIQVPMSNLSADWRVKATAITADTQVGESEIVVGTR